MYSSWQSDVTAVAEEQQVFVEKDAAPVTGTCGKTLTLDEESITITFDTAAAPKDRCGITVVRFISSTRLCNTSTCTHQISP